MKDLKTFINILFVDDEAELLTLFSEYIKYEGYKNVHTACSGTDALKIMQSHQIDIVFCDLMMPDMHGTQVYKKIKDLGQSPDFILLTGSYSSEAAKSAGSFLEVMHKPCSLKSIADRIEQVDKKNIAS